MKLSLDKSLIKRIGELGGFLPGVRKGMMVCLLDEAGWFNFE